MELTFSLAMIDGGFALAYLKYPFSKSEKYKVKELEKLIKENPKSYLGYCSKDDNTSNSNTQTFLEKYDGFGFVTTSEYN